VRTGLGDVTHMLYDAVAEGMGAVAADARARLAPLLAQKGGDPSLEISAIGHAHMDLAWLWPIRETKRKGARTFATVLDLLDRYPNYRFGASQPQYYLWMKENYPVLYEKIKEKVAEGRIEPQGAMWVEADTNVSGGEALVRQLIEGKRFFKEEFGVELNYLWLPDVFGYTAALPQILRLADVPYFSTQKLSWSLINVFPHHSFHWQGLDGTAVLTHMLPEETYNSPAAPRSVRKIEENYKESGVSHHSLMIYGIGDGGGGPGMEHLERLDRIENLAGLSPVTQEPVTAFFEKWGAEADRFPTWVGELYLERHEGTLTTEARNKWYNRKLELALRDLEWTAVLARALTGADYPAERLQSIWREVLLYQFHDILPGSSIKRVYDESLARYAAMHEEVRARTAENDTALAQWIDTSSVEAPVVVHNSLPWERTAWIRAQGGWQRVTIPSMGYKVVDAVDETPVTDSLTATESRLENDALRATFAEDGSLTSLYDKRLDREVLQPGAAGNRLAVYTDLGDAWDFPMDYAAQEPRVMTLAAAEAEVDGPRAVLTQTYRLGHSEVVQRIVLTAGRARLDFITRIHWREIKSMLRTSFPVAVHAEEATYEIQFGHIRRPTHSNTTWDLAKDEVCAHKWADLSQRDFGVALLNDSKYGHKIKDGVMDLDLLRSAPYPGDNRHLNDEVPPGEPHPGYTDQSDHEVTYALYVHPGDPIEGGVVQEGYALNVPLRITETDVHPGAGAPEASFLELDNPHVVVEAVKQAEDGDDVVIRLYEAGGGNARTTLNLGFAAEAVEEVNLMERPVDTPQWALDMGGDRTQIALTFRPFEIKTLKVTLA
jgi:alpha-mannosidase